MDLSGLIFVVLAVGWAAYLIPKALRHHEEIAASRPVDSFSETMRVLERTPATMKALLTPPAVAEPAGPRTRRTRQPSSPARRRRRVLGLLLLVTAGTGVAAYLAYLPAWTPAIPGVLVVTWLVMCRLMVRRAAPVRRRAAAPPVVGPVETSSLVEPVETSSLVEPVETSSLVEPVETSSLVEPVETAGETVAVPLPPEAEDDGSLWDPLPLTLPTYVSKPAARRTVRTIDLTQTGVTSSGHQVDATEIARQAEADAKAQDEPDAAAQRKVAGA